MKISDDPMQIFRDILHDQIQVYLRLILILLVELFLKIWVVEFNYIGMIQFSNDLVLSVLIVIILNHFLYGNWDVRRVEEAKVYHTEGTSTQYFFDSVLPFLLFLFLLCVLVFRGRLLLFGLAGGALWASGVQALVSSTWCLADHFDLLVGLSIYKLYSRKISKNTIQIFYQTVRVNKQYWNNALIIVPMGQIDEAHYCHLLTLVSNRR